MLFKKSRITFVAVNCGQIAVSNTYPPGQMSCFKNEQVLNMIISVTKIFTYWSFFIQNLVYFMDYRTRSTNLKLTLSYPPLWYQCKVCFLKAIVSLFFKDCNLMEMSTSPWPVKSWMLSADFSPIRNSCGDKTRYLDWKENTLIWHMYGVIVSAFFG